MREMRERHARREDTDYGRCDHARTHSTHLHHLTPATLAFVWYLEESGFDLVKWRADMWAPISTCICSGSVALGGLCYFLWVFSESQDNSNQRPPPLLFRWDSCVLHLCDIIPLGVLKLSPQRATQHSSQQCTRSGSNTFEYLKQWNKKQAHFFYHTVS